MTGIWQIEGKGPEVPFVPYLLPPEEWLLPEEWLRLEEWLRPPPEYPPPPLLWEEEPPE